jgi:HTH-type transcriptional regulator / antitoxin HipB
VKGRTLTEIHNEMMQDAEYRAAYETEERKERLQALLSEWKNNAGLTSAQIAERMGITPATVSRMEKNIASAKIDTLARYAQACGVKEATLQF